MESKEIIQDEEIICTGCGGKFPEDMINRDDEPLCEECYIEQGADRAQG
jgi:formylmethanofuran dehydrogenase subunit E